MFEKIEKEILAIIAEISEIAQEEIKPEAHFYEDLEIDSIRAIEIVVAIERKFNIVVRDEDVPNVTTVKESVELVQGLLNATSL